MKPSLYLASVFLLIAAPALANRGTAYHCDVKIVGTSLTDKLMVTVRYQPFATKPHSRPATQDLSFSTMSYVGGERQPAGRPLSALENFLIDHPSDAGTANRSNFKIGLALNMRLSGQRLPGILNPEPDYTLADYKDYVATIAGPPPVGRFEITTAPQTDGSFSLDITKFAGAENAKYAYTNGSKVPGEVEYQLQGLCSEN
jgi:hypothetical protein